MPRLLSTSHGVCSPADGDDSKQGPPTTTAPQAADGPQAAASPSELRLSLAQALTKLVDAAVGLVEEGNIEGAISVLQEGITTFEPQFPGSPELGELYNQVALLSLVAGDVEGAASHAERAHDMTLRAFGVSSALTGHRALRLGVARFAQSRLNDAAELLHMASEALTKHQDPSQFEAQFYLDLVLLSGAADTSQVLGAQDKLLASVRRMKDIFGAESMIMSLALAQHDRVVHQPLSAPEPNTQLCEALLKQHIKLLEAVAPEGEEVAVCRYKLGTFLYVQDMLQDAGQAVQQAMQGLRAVYPEDHDLVVLCKHRMGMILAASGEARAAQSLLEHSLARYSGSTSSSTGSSSSQEGDPAGASSGLSGLAREAAFGLALAKSRAGEGGASAARDEAVAAARVKLDELAAAIGMQHMLTQGALRHFSKSHAGSRQRR